MPDTESPPKLMRRLDYSSALGNDDDNDGGGGAALKSPPQHLNQNDAEQSFTSPLPTTPQSRSRSTLSSRTSLLGRRLAEERSRNHRLTIELEHIKSLLEREMKRNNDDIVFDLNESFYSSSPVNTPNATPVKCRRSGGGTPAPVAVAIEEDSNNEVNNNFMNMQRIQELELALQIETKLRKDAQAKLTESEQHSKILEQEVRSNCLQIGSDSPIHEYMQRASQLMNETNSSSTNGSRPLPTNNGYKNGTHNSYNSLHSIDEDDEEYNDDEGHNDDTSLSTVVHKMQEYEELVTAFHSELQNNHDELLSKDDLLWFFEELKWRFADIHRGVVAASKEPMRSNVQDNCKEWKNCLIGLVDELEYSIQKSKEQISDNSDKVEANLVDNELVAAMKRSYEEQLATQSQRIEQLEADAVEREVQFSEMQKKMKQDHHSMEEEKRKLSLSKDGTAARIRYLENMVQSLQVKLKKAQAQPDTEKVISKDPNDVNNDYASEIDSLAKALADSELKRAQLIDGFQAEREKFIIQYKQMNDVLKQFMYAESNQS
eukprot:scaffold821_cov105-Skeletonema_marinoi.AAC.9